MFGCRPRLGLELAPLACPDKLSFNVGGRHPVRCVDGDRDQALLLPWLGDPAPGGAATPLIRVPPPAAPIARRAKSPG